ncbi:MAG: hypothetical protein IJT27_09550 [Clostridia bacterium]|nr:hypothetical protein [Clostridia bacterium]
MKLQKKEMNNHVVLDAREKWEGTCSGHRYTEREDVPFGWGAEYCFWYDVEKLKIGEHQTEF